MLPAGAMVWFSSIVAILGQEFRMHSKFATFAAAFAIALAFAVPSPHANAATFNFAALATEGGVATGGDAPFASSVGEGTWDAKIGVGGYSVGGITVHASATNTSVNPLIPSKAYLDSPSGGPAGLGVCSSGPTGSTCPGTSDDNTGLAGDTGSVLETLILSFDSLVKLTDLDFRDRDHGLFNGSLTINGTNYNVVNGDLAVAIIATLFNFAANAGTPRLGFDFYLSLATVTEPPGGQTPVPIPGALPLFATGLIGLAWLGRRRKRKNAAALTA
jgi:hypothetical protein